jgi:TolB-like protein
MTSFALLLPLFWSPAASAQVFIDPVEDIFDDGPASVFVSPFQSKNPEAAGLAGMMSSFLEAELARLPELSVIPMWSVPAVHNMSAQVYLESCPPGKQVGCAFVVGSGAGASYALTGTVLSSETSTQVEITIIDVASSREALSFVATLGLGEDERFAEGVAAVLVAVARGEAGRVEDIRDLSVAAAPDYSAAVAQLAQLSGELGDIRAQTDHSGAVIIPPVITAEEISDRMDSEGVKPWERLGLHPDEYLRWKNSGEDLVSWRTRNNGRKGKVLLRTGLGLVRGPVDGRFRGIWVKDISEDNTGTSVTEAYAWHSMEAGTGFVTEVAVGYGITSEVEMGMQFGFATGKYRTVVDSKVTGNSSGDGLEESYANSSSYIGPYVQSVFRPAHRFRPLVGGGVVVWTGTTVDKHEDVVEAYDTFSQPTIWVMQLKGGLEFEVSKLVDFYLHVPVTIGLGGGSVDTFKSGPVGEAKDPDTDKPFIQPHADKPPGAAPIGGGVMFGLQFKFFGPNFH